MGFPLVQLETGPEWLGDLSKVIHLKGRPGALPRSWNPLSFLFVSDTALNYLTDPAWGKVYSGRGSGLPLEEPSGSWDTASGRSIGLNLLQLESRCGLVGTVLSARALSREQVGSGRVVSATSHFPGRCVTKYLLPQRGEELENLGRAA